MTKFLILFTFSVFINQVTNAQIVNIPDANFKAVLLSDAYEIDTNNDNEIQVSEAETVISLWLSGESITSLEGIQSFINLSYLDVTNNTLTELDLTQNVNLTELYFSYTNLNSALDLSQNLNLTTLFCPNNNLNSLDVSLHLNLTELYCFDNNLTTIDVTQNSLLQKLECENNFLNDLDVSQNLHLTNLKCLNNNISILDVSQNVNLSVLSCRNNNLSTLDLTNNKSLILLYCYNNEPLESLFLKNGYGQFYTNDTYFGLPNLKYVCIEDDYADDIREVIEFHNSGIDFSSLAINSYCSFTPGSEFYTISGTQYYDANSNGCDELDSVFPDLSFNVVNSNTSTSFNYTNLNGNYNIALQTGTYDIIPQLEQSDYFNISPETITINIEEENSPFTQDFCVVPNGTHNDLEINLIPTSQARPGFDANYRIIYRNKGTTTQSGYVTFRYLNSNEVSYVSATPNPSTIVDNMLTFDYVDLLPFESRVLDITLNMNPPTHPVFPLNQDDIINFIATVYPTANDEEPSDNVVRPSQKLVNSFDPNDKTCLEGEIIQPEYIGEYVHYTIRFENTGSTNAQNIVVKDVINTSEFDIESLVPLHSSHNYYLRKNGNIFEFIFENIQLPYDDLNNDGYLSFKIKTLSTLELGDTFENKVNIYFDYNFPIETNTALTNINTGLNIASFGSTYLTLNPNPVKQSFTIESQIRFNLLTIYDISGRLIREISTNSGGSTKLLIDTNNLSSGLYFIEVQNKNSSQIKKFIKE